MITVAATLMLVAARHFGSALGGASGGLAGVINHGRLVDGPGPIPDLSQAARELAAQAGRLSSAALTETKNLALSVRDSVDAKHHVRPAESNPKTRRKP